MPKRILILVSGSGGGHIQAGKNVARTIQELAPSALVVIKDSYDFLHAFKHWQYTTGWELLFQYAAPLYGFFRHKAGQSPAALRAIRKSFIPASRALSEWLELEEQRGGRFDAVVATQPHGAGLMDAVKLRAPWRETYLAQIWTDYQYYDLYFATRVDRYFAAEKEFAEKAHSLHPNMQITVSGIPIHPCFNVTFNKDEARRRFDLPQDGRPIVLITRGSLGYGSGKTLKLLKLLSRSKLPLTIVANAGRNQALAERMRAIQPHVLGWIDDMYALLAVTDILLAKPGGLMLAEALARGVPLYGFEPIPGQEEANLKFLEKHNVGGEIKNAKQAVAVVNKLIRGPGELTALKKRAAVLGFPDSSYRVAKTVLEDIGVSVLASNPQKSGQAC